MNCATVYTLTALIMSDKCPVVKRKSTSDLATATGLTGRTIQRKAVQGKVPGSHLSPGGHYWFDESPDLAQWISENTVRQVTQGLPGRHAKADYDSNSQHAGNLKIATSIDRLKRHDRIGRTIRREYEDAQKAVDDATKRCNAALAMVIQLESQIREASDSVRRDAIFRWCNDHDFSFRAVLDFRRRMVRAVGILNS